MARIKGLATFAANFETEKRAPLDARTIVEYKADLILFATWEAYDGNEWTYIGMTVTVMDDGVNNGIYVLMGTDYTDINNRKFVGQASGIILTDTVTAIDYYLVIQNGNLGIEPV